MSGALRKDRVIEAVTALVATANRSHRDLDLDPAERMYSVVSFADEVLRQMVEVTEAGGGHAAVPAEVTNFLRAGQALRALTAQVGRVGRKDDEK